MTVEEQTSKFQYRDINRWSESLGDYQTATGTQYVRKFDDWTDFVEAAVKNATPNGKARQGNTEWAGATFDEAVKLATEGWRTNIELVNVLLEAVRERLADVIDFSWERAVDMTGSEPDVDRYLAGELECMFDDTPTIAPHKGKALTMIVDCTITRKITAEEIFKRGAAIIALVQTMTMLGLELEIWVDMTVDSRQRRGKRMVTLVRVHKAGEPMDMDRVSYALGHPSMLRRLYFGVMEGEEKALKDDFGFYSGGGYGTPCGIHDGAEIVDASFTVSWGNRTLNQIVKSPVQWVLDQLALQGVYDPPDDADDVS